MKKFLSASLALAMLLSTIVLPVSATEAGGNWNGGTLVSYDAEDPDGDGIKDNTEAYTVTVPAQLAPGTAGEVVLAGTWSSDRKVIVTADAEVVLENSINPANTKTLDVTFETIKQAGDNTAAIEVKEEVSVAGVTNAIFGTWSGTFNYFVDIVNASNGGTLTIIRGDVNGDGEITEDDFELVSEFNATIKTPTPVQEVAADVNGDGQFSFADYLIFNQYINNVISEFPAGNEVVIIYGDVDGDGEITQADADIVMQVGGGIITLTNIQKIAADVNGNGKVNTSDAQLIAQYANGGIDKFPVAESGSGSGGTEQEPAVEMITFTIDGVEYQAEEDMTWAAWIDSEYNPGEFEALVDVPQKIGVSQIRVKVIDNPGAVGDAVFLTDTIADGVAYHCPDAPC